MLVVQKFEDECGAPGKCEDEQTRFSPAQTYMRKRRAKQAKLFRLFLGRGQSGESGLDIFLGRRAP